MKAVLATMTETDFFRSTSYKDGITGVPLVGDEYAPWDAEGNLWYVKMTRMKGIARLESCHLAREDARMPDGTKRYRRPR
jgi:hypothetical protein